jgi:hypothetical protein
LLNRSTDPRDHLGFLTLWVGEAHRARRFPLWERDEVLSEAYIQADRLLTTVYDPERATVVTFLKRFLPGAVHYRYWTSNGFRFTADGPRLKLPVTYDTLCEVAAHVPPPSSFRLPDLSEEEWTIVRLRLDGYTMTRIASVLGLRSPQSIYNRIVKIKDKFHGKPDPAAD